MHKPKQYLYLERSDGNSIKTSVLSPEIFVEGEEYRLDIPKMGLKGKYKCVAYQISDQSFQWYLSSAPHIRDWFLKAQGYV